MMRRIAGAALAALLLAGCASDGDEPPAAPPASSRTPEGCGRNYPRDTPVLKLEDTRAPSEKKQKTEPFKFANQLRVKEEIAAKGLWTDFDDGWSKLTLRLSSDGALSLALHLTRLELPARSQIWFCSADGRFVQGPYREAPGGELWTPVVPGAEAKLQIDVPTLERVHFKGELAEAFGGFR